ncbi:hypothetical protein I4632_11550 [Proteus mirabilis]|uniref:hypothetical protein n=1 Tax=Proteus TaxID=583 RepID=UPI000659AD2C|nr:hypothetical protein [Proteus vulgaris]MBG3080835.1 hypothetical protein [Proteus mirabilis]QPN91512.1 hypothetical protein IM703_03200 [Proteus vulgaris]WIF72638.1 hypothetical protein QN092_01745 [Proteus vulgaris]CRL62832.1 hypothetical protein BN1805_01975 [Proteus vulgaris]
MKQRLFQFFTKTRTLMGRKRIHFFPIAQFFETPLIEGFFLAYKKPLIAQFIAKGEL